MTKTDGACDDKKMIYTHSKWTDSSVRLEARGRRQRIEENQNHVHTWNVSFLIFRFCALRRVICVCVDQTKNGIVRATVCV